MRPHPRLGGSCRYNRRGGLLSSRLDGLQDAVTMTLLHVLLCVRRVRTVGSTKNHVLDMSVKARRSVVSFDDMFRTSLGSVHRFGRSQWMDRGNSGLRTEQLEVRAANAYALCVAPYPIIPSILPLHFA